jgi:hypothetical protein
MLGLKDNCTGRGGMSPVHAAVWTHAERFKAKPQFPTYQIAR